MWPTDAYLYSQSCETNTLWPNYFITIDLFPNMNFNSFKLLHVAFICLIRVFTVFQSMCFPWSIMCISVLSLWAFVCVSVCVFPCVFQSVSFSLSVYMSPVELLYGALCVITGVWPSGDKYQKHIKARALVTVSELQKGKRDGLREMYGEREKPIGCLCQRSVAVWRSRLDAIHCVYVCLCVSLC